jgi:glycosyltransferase involved in cell wall biosynthesis
MKIGIDLRALQTGHKFRGIGEVAKQTTNRIIELAHKNKEISFVFYEYDEDDPKELLNLPKGLSYEVVKLGMMPENNTTSGKLDKIRRNFNELYGAPIKDSAKSDVFLQFDYAFGVPKNTRTVLVKHDLIPYVFWNSFFESAWVPFKNKALRTTLRTIFANHKYKQILRRSLKNAGLIISVSESTKKDIQRYFKVPESKAIVAHLGVDMAPAKTNQTDSAERLPTKPYLLFIGAGDARRRVDDLVTAFNNLKADGHDIQLVLVGENFKAPEAIPNTNVRKAVLESSYKNDILTLGYVDDITKQKLYRDAVAFVYPTKYEGFGIPVLEAMLLECPIITYKNSSIPEVGGKHALYANNWMDIQKRTEELLSESPKVRQRRLQLAKAHAEQFTWDKTATIIYEELTR